MARQTKAEREAAVAEVAPNVDQELVRIYHPELGGEPAVATRGALRNVHAAKGFVEVVSPEGADEIEYLDADAAAEAATARLVEADTEGETL